MRRIAAALLFTSCIKYDPSLVLNVHTEGLNQRATQHAIDSLYTAAYTLKACKYLKRHYPETADNLHQTLKSPVQLSAINDSEVCGEAILPNKIALNLNDIQEFKKDNCHIDRIAAHELLHLAGLTDHEVIFEIVWECM